MHYPLYRQLDSKDCGPTCLRMVARFYGRKLSPDYARSLCGTGRSGSTLLALSEAAEAIGMRTAGVRLTWEELVYKVDLPCILMWRDRHYVVCYRIVGEKVILGDPAAGILKYSRDVFLRNWKGDSDKGIALLMSPGEEFREDTDDGGRPRITFRSLLRYLTPYTRQVIQIVSAILLGSLLNFIFPFLTQFVVDIGIPERDLTFIILILIAQFVLMFGRTANDLIKNWLMLHVTVRISLSLIKDFLSRMMRLPIAFFDSRLTGDLIQRINDFDRIQRFLTGSLISMSMALIALLVYGGVLLSYSSTVLCIFLTGSILYILWILLFLRQRKKLDYMRFQELAGSQSNVIQLIHGMQEIKLNNCGERKRKEWEDIQIRLFRISLKGMSLTQAQTLGGTFIDQAKNILMSFAAAYSVVRGDMTLGMMMALQYVIGQMNAPIYELVGFIQQTQDTAISLERLNDINSLTDEQEQRSGTEAEIPRSADIGIRDVTFRYGGPRSPAVLRGISLNIEAGKTTAIVGVSGSGKSTLLKLILGFYAPSSGQITLGGKDLSGHSIKAWRQACGTVMQEGFIFSDSIAGNISVSDDTPDMQRIQYALRTAMLDEFVNSLPQKERTEIGEDGLNLSVGQKQRVLIARAIYKNAPYLILDEATNSLDANNERLIQSSLDGFYKDRTVIVVAHRLSTVRNADKIVVMDRGRIVEEGRHEDLIRRKGHYYHLVINQLELGQ